ncbi:MAG: hypothetical protein MJE77_06375 [Proteobacteria bacterium]|nr:hypothetical protein [Pseudomonadota bacterium]
MSEQESQFLSVIRVWAALAWSDGVIVPAEAAAMRKVIGAAALTDEERATALSWLEHEVELDTDQLTGLTDQARLGIYRAAAQLAVVDLKIVDAERVFLRRLRRGLHLTEQQAAEIIAAIPDYGKTDSTS